MLKIINILIFVFFPLVISLAQTDLDTTDIDAKTYKLYIEKKWDNLIDLGKYAISKNIDFYYLRMRIGIACYEKKNYISAIPHFEKALEYKKQDLVASEYLYYSYLFSGRKEEAKLILSDLSPSDRKKLKINTLEFIENVYTEGGFVYNSEFSSQKKNNISGSEKLYGEQTIIKNYYYFSFGLSHNITNHISLFHSYNNFSYSFTKQINENKGGLKEFNLNTAQNDYYLKVNFYAGKGFGFGSAFHFINISGESVDFMYDNQSKPVYKQSEVKENDFVFNFYADKYLGNFLTGYSFSYSDLNNAKQIQNGLTLIYYPLGNLNLYFVSNLYYFSQKYSGAKFLNHWIEDLSGGVKISDNLWFEAGFTAGDIYNFNEFNGFTVYNNLEKIKRRLKLNLIIPVIYDKLVISIRYNNLLLEHSYLTKISNTDYKLINNNYINHSLIGGLKWTL